MTSLNPTRRRSAHGPPSEGSLLRVQRGLVAVARELEAMYGTVAHQLERVEGLLGRSPGAPFWEHPRGLDLRRAEVDSAARELVVAFGRGPEYRLPLRKLGLPSHPVSARLDRSRDFVILRLADGTRREVPSDRVLYECDAAYRTAHRAPPERRRKLGKRVRELRRAFGLVAAEVAAAAGLARSNYARLEAGKHEPRIDTLVRVAAALRVPLSELFTPPGSQPSRRLTGAQAARLAGGAGSRGRGRGVA